MGEKLAACARTQGRRPKSGGVAGRPSLPRTPSAMPSPKGPHSPLAQATSSGVFFLGNLRSTWAMKLGLSVSSVTCAQQRS